MKFADGCLTKDAQWRSRGLLILPNTWRGRRMVLNCMNLKAEHFVDPQVNFRG